MSISKRAVTALLVVGLGSAALTAVATAGPQQERFTRTICYPAAKGVNPVAWHGAPVSASQPVAVSISEGVLNAEGLGDARMMVENVTVVNNAVLTRINIMWGEKLPYCLHYVG
ncbi:hypothetical protein M8C13_18760 [Crossiella sp. SN42]|uniref:hypothetical protein n=1 Tax=Crossiella sp. SN42 TaxID=2944808 RepID=UPI00207D3A75|nr:hypothetical protein [Crossiella sp. SN42]MCO1577800.1 hypothetical protein [Crossiella sp. SN42]